MLFNWCIILYNQQHPYKNGLIQKFEGQELKIYIWESSWKNIGLSWDLRWELKLLTSKLDVNTINIFLLTEKYQITHYELTSAWLRMPNVWIFEIFKTSLISDTGILEEG